MNTDKIQTVLAAWNTYEESGMACKASCDDFIDVALTALGLPNNQGTDLGDGYYALSCDGATEEELAAYILARAV